jgi:hypothetical protein
MNAALLGKLFGQDQRWLGPCTVILDAEASVQALGTDSIAGGGNKLYAPRSVSGRVAADAVCLLPDAAALLMLQQQKTRSTTGEERVHQTLVIADVEHVIAVEFQDTAVLANLGLTPPAIRLTGSQHGLAVKQPPSTPSRS